MPTFPSQAWLDAYRDAINASAPHREVAGDWEGDVSLVIEADPDAGLGQTLHAWLDLWRGECREARIVGPDEADRARFVIRAPYSRWKDVMLGRLEPLRGMTQGKLKLRGDLPVLARYVPAIQLLVTLAGEIPTTFVDEAGGPGE